MINQSFILCAGKATRLYPLTLDKPKCLLNINNKCILDLIIKWLNYYNINNIICNAHWKKEMIIDHINYLKKNISIQVETEILGTCGAINQSIDLLDNDFIIVYGDMVIDLNLNRIINKYHETKADLMIVSRRTETPWECGVLYSDKYNRIYKIIEKPDKDKIETNLVNGGILICNKKIFKNKFFDISKDLIPFLLENNYRIFHEEILENEVLIDMGTFKNYELARNLYDNNKNAT